jgi:hypothetical protein
VATRKVLFSAIFTLFFLPLAAAAEDRITAEDFDKDGGMYGTWNRLPNDLEHRCLMSVIQPGRDGKGRCVRLCYSIDLSNGAYNGFWLKLNKGAGLDLTGCKKLVFWVKGDKDSGYTRRIKLELKSTDEISKMYVEGMKDDWNMIEIELRKFVNIKKWDRMKELVITFNSFCTVRNGAIYVDDIHFTK